MFDMKDLSRLKQLDQNAPEAMKRFWAFDQAVFAEGALSVQQKQLIAVAVALTTQCPYCIALHTKAARDAGASNEQLAEAALVAAGIRAGVPSRTPRTCSAIERTVGKGGHLVHVRKPAMRTPPVKASTHTMTDAIKGWSSR